MLNGDRDMLHPGAGVLSISPPCWTRRSQKAKQPLVLAMLPLSILRGAPGQKRVTDIHKKTSKWVKVFDKYT